MRQQFNNTETALESRARSLLLDSIHSVGAGEHKFIYPTEWFQEGVVESTTTLSKFLVQLSFVMLCTHLNNSLLSLFLCFPTLF